MSRLWGLMQFRDPWAGLNGTSVGPTAALVRLRTLLRNRIHVGGTEY
jgi:hypothetical protein